jgi:hypothetical protein
MDLYIHRFPDAVGMPIPPVAEHMEIYEAGAVSIGVEFRVLTQELVAALGKAVSQELGRLDDVGVSLHVFVRAADGELERLRFDCFQDDPHYHYLSWSKQRNDHVFIDPTLHGDVLAWALNVIRTRLPQMLERTGIENAAALVDARRLEAILPRVTEAAYRARFHADRARVEQGALADGARLSRAAPI